MFSIQIPDCDTHSTALLNLFLLMQVFSTISFSTFRNFNHVVFSVFIDSKWDVPFHRLAYDYSCADWDSLCDHLRNVPLNDIFKLRASATSSEFCE